MGINDWVSFTIMHKDTKVVTIFSDGAVKIHNSNFMPYNLYLINNASDIKSRLTNLDNFYHWCSSRVLTLDRKYAKEILNSIGMKQAVSDRDRADIAIAYHGLSLIDVYWITNDFSISFNDINLFDNSLSNSFVDVSLCGKQLTAQNAALVKNADVASDIGTMGVAPKAWVRKDDGFYLFKDGNKRDVDAELLASKIINCFNVEHINYFEDNYNNQKVSASKIITSKDVSIVSMDSVDIFAANNDTTIYDMAIKYDSYTYYMMNIVDYLVGNTDRHWGNWGFLVDNSTNKPIKIYPLMDFNKAFNNYDNLDGAKCQTVAGNVSQKDWAIDAVKHIGLNQIGEISADWFNDKSVYKIFMQRLNLLQSLV